MIEDNKPEHKRFPHTLLYNIFFAHIKEDMSAYRMSQVVVNSASGNKKKISSDGKQTFKVNEAMHGSG